MQKIINLLIYQNMNNNLNLLTQLENDRKRRAELLKMRKSQNQELDASHDSADQLIDMNAMSRISEQNPMYQG